MLCGVYRKADITNFVNKVTLDSGATVDLTFDEVATTKVDIADYNGTGGNIIMDTDLASEADGDKINITTGKRRDNICTGKRCQPG